jgi:hypothetical protein
MTTTEFKPGDRVISLETDRTYNITGTVLKYKKEDSKHALIEFDENIGGHDGDRMGKQGYCWWVSSNRLKYSSIYFNNNIILLLL